jgi:hypothetical protein
MAVCEAAHISDERFALRCRASTRILMAKQMPMLQSLLTRQAAPATRNALPKRRNQYNSTARPGIVG